MRRRFAVALVCLFAGPVLAAPPLAVCKRPEVASNTKQGDAKAREAAHKGFTYLAAASIAWTKQNNCFGCHVQAVTMEALTAARHHQYDVDPKDLEAMVKALSMGVTAGGTRPAWRSRARPGPATTTSSTTSRPGSCSPPRTS